MRRWFVPLATATLLAAARVYAADVASLGDAKTEAPAGDAARGERLITQFGCGTCHVVPGVPSAQGNVGPPLTRMGSRIYVAGVLPNTPEHMVEWLRFPQRVVPNNGMPDLGLNETDARDIAAFIATLK